MDFDTVWSKVDVQEDYLCIYASPIFLQSAGGFNQLIDVDLTHIRIALSGMN